MSSSPLLRSCLSTCILLLVFLTTSASAYFLIDEPHRDTQWVTNQANLVQWKKGLLDGVNGFDLEMARLSTDGLTLIAKNVPAQQQSLNIFLQDVQPGDDYFLVFMNSTHGVMYATSPRFTILAPGAAITPNSTAAAGLPPNNAVPTVTVSGAPDPTKAFVTTFPALPNNGVVGGWKGLPGVVELGMLVLGTLVCVAAGGVWTVS